MIAAIIGITGFQLYWLQQNYSREKKTLGIKTDMAFRETLVQLQVKKFNLDGLRFGGNDSNEVRIMVRGNHEGLARLNTRPKEEIISTIDVIRDKMKGRIKDSARVNPRMVITMKNSTMKFSGDSLHVQRTMDGIAGEDGGQIINLLYGVDSLQEPLQLTEIDSAYRERLQKEKLPVPFLILARKGNLANGPTRPGEITIGLTDPITYQLQLGNTVPFLLRQLLLPILFSILLLGITVMSFVLLYRNLLKQRRLALLKNEFISNITHELKTPIATVGVAIEALKNFNAIQDPQRTQEYLAISQNELQRLGLLVDKVLKLSMFEKKEMELKPETVDLEEVVDEVVSSLKLQLEKYHARVTVNKTGDTSLQGDRLHLLSVVFNLLDNALKYSRTEPSIRIDIEGSTSSVMLRVTDNGIGIAPEYKARIFDKFFRVPQGDTHNAKGYGLGLSYAAQVVRKHGGQIEVESQPGHGSSFLITLPKRSA